MNLLSVESVSKRYGERLLFGDISFGIHKGQKTALVAKNGTGKSSLLKIIAGLEPPDSGNVTVRNGITVGYLEQSPIIDPTKTILENILHSNDPKLQVLMQYENAIEENNYENIEKLLPLMEQHQLWDAESKVTSILGALNLTRVNRLADKLSGGEQKRIALAGLIFANPDLIILDEPTNHLDLDMVEWLEQYLSGANQSILMVTHDRYFLENVCEHILEIDNEQLYSYDGNFTYYLTKKSERISNEETSIEKAKNVFRKELDWIRRQPKARTTKSKARVDAFDDVKKDASKRINKSEIAIDFKSDRLGNKILELHNVGKSFEDKTLFKNFNYKFLKGDKVGIAGKNGAGKTTLVNIILERLQPDTGKVVIGETVKIGVYEQKGLEMKKDQRVLEVLTEIAEVIEEKEGKVVDAARLLEKFLFTRKDQHKKTSTLSGGERRRLYLVSVLMGNPNFLILDEPTNDLDILTLNILEDYLKNFDGCVLLITHDRYLLDKVVDHTFIFEGDATIKDYVGKYTEYRASKKQLKSVAPPKQEKETKENPKAQEKNKLSYKEKLEFEELDKLVPKMEEQKEKLNQEISSGELSVEDLQNKVKELGKLTEEIDEKSMRWLELAELYQP